jgi:hypothetical protein
MHQAPANIARPAAVMRIEEASGLPSQNGAVIAKDLYPFVSEVIKTGVSRMNRVRTH